MLLVKLIERTVRLHLQLSHQCGMTACGDGVDGIACQQPFMQLDSLLLLMLLHRLQPCCF